MSEPKLTRFQREREYMGLRRSPVPAAKVCNGCERVKMGMCLKCGARSPGLDQRHEERLRAVEKAVAELVETVDTMADVQLAQARVLEDG